MSKRLCKKRTQNSAKPSSNCMTPELYKSRSRQFAVARSSLSQTPEWLPASLDGVLFNKEHTTLLQFPGGLAGSYAISNSVTNIGNWAFHSCSGLTELVIPDSVATIGDQAFIFCYGLQKVYFQGNAPAVGKSAFAGATAGTVYYLEETTGWRRTFGGWRTALYEPATLE
ncbi:MAG: leucine-rich repeat protein [Pontiellaceae bacterium]|nr:leucine-rich repeat protein [Pontiellaceae bacterium]